MPKIVLLLVHAPTVQKYMQYRCSLATVAKVVDMTSFLHSGQICNKHIRLSTIVYRKHKKWILLPHIALSILLHCNLYFHVLLLPPSCVFLNQLLIMPSSDIYEMDVCVSECATPSNFLLVCIVLYTRG